jgi:hypothetical protein
MLEFAISPRTLGDGEPGKIESRLSRSDAELQRRSHLVLLHSKDETVSKSRLTRETQYKLHQLSLSRERLAHQ